MLRLLEAAEAELTQWTLDDLRSIGDELVTYETDDLNDGEGNVGCDVRLRVQVADDGASYCYSVLWGDPSYDTDHRGFWGSSFLERGADDVALTDVARDLIEQVLEHCAQCEPDSAPVAREAR